MIPVNSLLRFLVRVVEKTFSPTFPDKKHQIHEHEKPNDANGNEVLPDEIYTLVRLHSATAGRNQAAIGETNEYKNGKNRIQTSAHPPRIQQ